MLTYSGGLLDPAARTAAIEEAMTAIGADPEDFAAEIGSTTDLHHRHRSRPPPRRPINLPTPTDHGLGGGAVPR